MKREKKSGSERVAVILAGGASQRFGSDKIWALYQGKPLIEVLIHTLERAGFSIVLSGPKKKLKCFDSPVVEDEDPLKGPLHALNTIWKNIHASKMLVTAADMPFITPEIIEELWQTSTDTDITLLETQDSLSPLPGVYSSRTQRVIEALLKNNRHDLKALWTQDLKIMAVPEQKWRKIDPENQSLYNINFPGDLMKIPLRRRRASNETS